MLHHPAGPALAHGLASDQIKIYLTHESIVCREGTRLRASSCCFYRWISGAKCLQEMQNPMNVDREEQSQDYDAHPVPPLTLDIPGDEMISISIYL